MVFISRALSFERDSVNRLEYALWRELFPQVTAARCGVADSNWLELETIRRAEGLARYGVDYVKVRRGR